MPAASLAPVDKFSLRFDARVLICRLRRFSIPAVAFTLVDINGDGQVSKNDLVRYLELITAAPEGVKVDLVRTG